MKDQKKIKCVIDSSVLIAFFNKKDVNHYESKTAIDALNNRNVIFVLPHLVIAEFFGKRNQIGEKVSVKKAIEIYEHFIKNIGHYLVGGPAINLNSVIDNYKRHSRHRKLTEARFNDFFILTQAELMKSCIIVTNDEGMYKCGKNYYRKQIFFLPKTDRTKSGLSNLITYLQNK